MQHYRAPRWLPGAGAVGGHLQTIWPALFARRFDGTAPRYRRERWETPDGDFIDVDFLADPPPAADAPWLVLFHGLEGSSASHYAQAFAHWARDNGWAFAVPHFRGCSGELNRAPRAYHSGDFEEVGWILESLRARSPGPLVAVGVSLGGNALLRWAEEAGETAAHTARCVCAVSSPLDLAASGHAIGRGFNRQIYTRMFLRTMRPKALAKLAQHPGLFDREAMLAARDLYAFDDLFTAPLHGFRDTLDYWSRASAKPQLSRIRLPALVVNARNDPFVPAASLPAPSEVGKRVTLWQPAHGGHVGFPGGAPPGHLHTLPDAVMRWVQAES
ncbi:MAG: alpha/beta fold hydrolase [Burkholderiaceae bacterium]|nr:alpha/beta fold hydrolase [Burkholderiaceae bacterium]